MIHPDDVMIHPHVVAALYSASQASVCCCCRSRLSSASLHHRSSSIYKSRMETIEDPARGTLSPPVDPYDYCCSHRLCPQYPCSVPATTRTLPAVSCRAPRVCTARREGWRRRYTDRDQLHRHLHCRRAAIMISGDNNK